MSIIIITIICRFENILSKFDCSRRYEVFTSDMHKTTIEENSKHVDKIESLQKLLGEAREEILILKQKKNQTPLPHYQLGDEPRFMQQQKSIVSGVKMTSDLLNEDGNVPAACPMGGCMHYESVIMRGGGSDVMKNFQNHLNNTHRVGNIIPIFLLLLFCACLVCYSQHHSALLLLQLLLLPCLISVFFFQSQCKFCKIFVPAPKGLHEIKCSQSDTTTTTDATNHTKKKRPACCDSSSGEVCCCCCATTSTTTSS